MEYSCKDNVCRALFSVWHIVKSVTVSYYYFSFIFLFIIYLLFLFLAVLGLRFCARAFSSCGEWGPLFIAVRGPLTIAASLVAEHRLQTLRLSSCGSRAQPLRGMWDLPRPGLEPVCPALAGRFSTTAPPGKPTAIIIWKQKIFNRIWSSWRPLGSGYKEKDTIFWETCGHLGLDGIFYSFLNV